MPSEKIYECEIELPVTANADYAKKSCELEYKVEATQGNAETSDSSVEIIGLEGTYSDLTAAAIALRESYGINTVTGNFGGHSDELTRIDSIQWIISGTVGSGDGNHVVGGGGAILSGGYIYPAIEIDKVVVKGINDAVLVNQLGTDYAFTSGGKTVIYDMPAKNNTNPAKTPIFPCFSANPTSPVRASTNKAVFTKNHRK